MSEHATAVPPAQAGKRSPRWLLAPLLALAFFSLLAGLLAKAYVPDAGSYPGGYFDLFVEI